MKAVYDEKTTAMMKHIQSLIDDRITHLTKELTRTPDKSTSTQMLSIRDVFEISMEVKGKVVKDPILAILRKRMTDLIAVTVPVYQVIVDNKA